MPDLYCCSPLISSHYMMNSSPPQWRLSIETAAESMCAILPELCLDIYSLQGQCCSVILLIVILVNTVLDPFSTFEMLTCNLRNHLLCIYF